MKHRGFLSLDTETTGLSTDRAHVLQVAAVWDDGGPLESLRRLNLIVDPGPLLYSEVQALVLNSRLLSIIAAFRKRQVDKPGPWEVRPGELTGEVLRPYDARKRGAPAPGVHDLPVDHSNNAVVVPIEHARRIFQAWVRDITNASGLRRVTIAGKNAAGFDIPILKANGFDVSMFSHKVLDPGSLYFPDYGYPPSLTEINMKLGRRAVTHDALDDAFDVVAAIRAKLPG